MGDADGHCGGGCCAPLLLVARAVLSVANRVAYRVLLVPMRPFAFWLGAGLSAVHVAVYGVGVIGAVCAGSLDDAALEGPPFGRIVAMGLFDCLGSLLGLTAAAVLPGPTIVVLSQSMVPFLLVTSWATGGRRGGMGQGVAALGILAGVALAVTDLLNTDGHGAAVAVGLALGGLCCSALSFTIKEQVFLRHPDLPILWVTFLGGVAHLIAALLLLPLVTIPVFGAVPLPDLPNYLLAGGYCCTGTWRPELLMLDYNASLSNITSAPSLHFHIPNPATTACLGMPVALVAYCAAAVLFSVAAVAAARANGPTASFAVGTLAMVGQYGAFAVDWPLLPRAQYTPQGLAGFAVVVVSVIAHREITRRQEKQEAWQVLRPVHQRG